MNTEQRVTALAQAMAEVDIGDGGDFVKNIWPDANREMKATWLRHARAAYEFFFGKGVVLEEDAAREALERSIHVSETGSADGCAWCTRAGEYAKDALAAHDARVKVRRALGGA